MKPEFEWRYIQEVQSEVAIDGMADVIRFVTFGVYAREAGWVAPNAEGEAQMQPFGYTYRTVELPLPDRANFIPASDVSRPQVIEWAMAALGETECAALEQAALYELLAQVQPILKTVIREGA